MTGKQQRRYFAASNSADGFINYFPKIFENVGKRLFVIKGGPGTGKSCFMKQVGKQAEANGYPVTYYYCSSDPDSLDGLVIGGMDVGFIDGTAPHVWEPRSVGVFEQILNFGEFWQADRLLRRRDRIEALSAKKKDAYRRAYRYLAAYGHVMRATAEEVASAIYSEKLEKAAERLVKQYGSENGVFWEQTAVCSAIGMRGRARFDTYERNADKLYTVTDHGGTAHFFFEALYKACRHRGVRVCLSRDPILPERIDALCLTDSGVTFTTEGEGTPVNMRRFVNEEAYRTLRSEIKRKNAIAGELVTCAEREFEAIRTHHFAIETQFAAAMDFSAKEAYTETFCTKLFGKA